MSKYWQIIAKPTYKLKHVNGNSTLPKRLRENIAKNEMTKQSKSKVLDLLVLPIMELIELTIEFSVGNDKLLTTIRYRKNSLYIYIYN